MSTGTCTARPILEVLEKGKQSGVLVIERGTQPRHFDPWKDEQCGRSPSACS
jgi:hypothetical protein